MLLLWEHPAVAAGEAAEVDSDVLAPVLRDVWCKREVALQCDGFFEARSEVRRSGGDAVGAVGADQDAGAVGAVGGAYCEIGV